jgi:DNA-binding XRE family transcriptional regulator
MSIDRKFTPSAILAIKLAGVFGKTVEDIFVRIDGANPWSKQYEKRRVVAA